MSDEWRVEVHLQDEGHGLTLGDRLRSLDLDDEARKRLGERVIVTRDGSRMFLYTGSEQTASEAERVAKDLAAEDGLDAKTKITRWHPDEEEWLDPSAPMPQSEAQRAAEHREHEAHEEREAAATGRDEWELRVDLDSLGDTSDLSSRLSDAGIPHHRRWKHVLIPAATEEHAAELADRVRELSPAEPEMHVEPAPGSLPHPAFVVIGGRTPGIARDLGL
ncbi:MAG: hypothetical protein E6G49_08195 [Actinobacteria bacterium]|jgi:hypothetical protein|nr:MAG: hypothetical protein E6G49_08195 [Actinomycetota bacterium]